MIVPLARKSVIAGITHQEPPPSPQRSRAALFARQLRAQGQPRDPFTTTAGSAPDRNEAGAQDFAQLLERGLFDLLEAIAAQSAIAFELEVGAVEIGSTAGEVLLRIGVVSVSRA